MLQWGHNFFVMEISLGIKIFPMRYRLQWGHNFFVMEIRIVVRCILFQNPGFNGAITFSLWKSFSNCCTYLIIYCFNGAITFSLWKCVYRYGLVPTLVKLQWGHNFFVMEIIPESLPPE